MNASANVETSTRRDRFRLLQPTKSLLLIEDDLSMIEFVDMVLEQTRPDLDWEYVTSGEEAVKLIRRRGAIRGDDPYSLVITDIFLEGEMTGFDVWLESMQMYPKMPFVITSSLTFDRYFSILRGVANTPVYLPKPLTVGRCQSVFAEYF